MAIVERRDNIIRDKSLIREYGVVRPDWDGHNMLSRRSGFDPPEETETLAVAEATAHEIPRESETVSLTPQESGEAYAEVSSDGERIEVED